MDWFSILGSTSSQATGMKHSEQIPADMVTAEAGLPGLEALLKAQDQNGHPPVERWNPP